MRFGVIYEGEFPEDAAPDEIEAHLDAVMDELVTLDAIDPSIGLAGRVAEISLTIEANGPAEAVARSGVLLRTALHAAGGSTADWPMPHPSWVLDWLGSSTRKTDLIDA